MTARPLRRVLYTDSEGRNRFSEFRGMTRDQAVWQAAQMAGPHSELVECHEVTAEETDVTVQGV